MSKYGSRKTTCGQGHLHDSKREAIRCQELYLLFKAGQIKKLQVQVKFTLLEPFTHWGKKIRGIDYYADFTYKEAGHFVIEDCKGMRTETYKLKKKLLLNQLKDMPEEVRFIET